MKKTIISIFISTLLLSSCSINNSADHQVNSTMNPSEEANNVWIMSNIESGVFKDEFIVPENVTREEMIVDATKTKVNIGALEFDLYPLSVCYSDVDTITKYRSENGNCLYQINKSGDYFSIQAQPGYVLETFSGEELCEETLFCQINKFILGIAPNENLEKYQINTQTRIVVQKQDATWTDNKNQFYFADENNNESVMYYTLNYKQFVQGLPTSNYITVKCNNVGDITEIEYHVSDIEWNLYSIDLENIKNRVNAFLSAAVSEEYVLVKYNILSESLFISESSACILVSCEATLLHNGSEIVVMCPLKVVL